MSRRKRPITPARLLRSAVPDQINRPDADKARLPLREIAVPPSVAMLNAANGYHRAYRLGECTVIVTREWNKWHLSIAHPSRYPTWDEISEARYRVLPDGVWMAMMLPPRSNYVNLHRWCFQLIEVEPSPVDLVR
jgi:hypothetical protein